MCDNCDAYNLIAELVNNFALGYNLITRAKRSATLQRSERALCCAKVDKNVARLDRLRSFRFVLFALLGTNQQMSVYFVILYVQRQRTICHILVDEMVA